MKRMLTPLLLLPLLLGSSLAAWGQSSTKPPQIPDTMAQRMLACSACHGPEGRATNEGFFPRIAGKPAGYIYNQLINFREGRRVYPAMTRLIDPLSDAYLKEIATYFSGLDLPYPAPLRSTASVQDMARGETLAKKGDKRLDIPACAECHGDALTGQGDNIPGLLGLPADYVKKQLGSWRTHQRKAAAPDCMASVARRLPVADIEAVVHWLSAQPLPAHTKATPLLGKKLPMDCGSVKP